MPVQFEPGFWDKLNVALQSYNQTQRSRKERDEEMKIAAEERKKAEDARMAQLILNAQQSGAIDAGAATERLTQRGFDLGPLAPTQAELQRNIIANPQGMPTQAPLGFALPGAGGKGGMRAAPATVTEMKPFSELQYEQANLMSPSARASATLAQQAQDAINRLRATATPGQLAGAAGVPSLGKVATERRQEYGDIVQRDATGFTWEQATASPTSKPNVWAEAAFGKFKAARGADGLMNPAEIEAERPAFFAAASAAQKQMQELELRKREVDAAAQRLAREGLQSAGPLLQSVNNEMEVIQRIISGNLVASIAFSQNPEEAKKKYPELAQQMQRYQQLQAYNAQLQQAVAKQLGIQPQDVPTTLGVTSGAQAPVKLSSPMQDNRYKALSQLPPETAKNMLAQGLQQKTLTQQEYDELSKALGVKTPYQTPQK